MYTRFRKKLFCYHQNYNYVLNTRITSALNLFSGERFFLPVQSFINHHNI
ncbi:hypothetical protein CIT292_08527 [Citrobacter youngae ATCC 29220]|uniref:Uncharacterized protein n=1 Tax=Citrobacter youngae ATCC 29220 TaxID=500640 RepID=D4BDG0_9ENTR|nr:hypothetical protein CIT292_08527 [Citrobacter youngae ATCC 29220]